MSKSFCFDLDDTICFPNHSETDTYEKYGKAYPNDQLISYMRCLKDKYDCHIVILSARRMLTHHGDLEAIKDDVGEITETWLKTHDVPYDELVFGKPYASEYYVDDKAMNLEDFYTHMKKLQNEEKH